MTLASALLLGLIACRPVAAPTVAAGARLSFVQREHDLGRISSVETTEYRFVFTNVGDRPLEIGEIERRPTRAGGCT